MEILFLVPPLELNSKKTTVDRVYGCNYGFDYKPPIHLLVLATVAKQAGHSVRLLDCPAEGYNLRKLIDYIKKKEVDITVFFTVWLSQREDLLAAELIHNAQRHTKIIFTGPFPTWKPQLFLKNYDYMVIRGEPEGVFTRHLEKLKLKEENFHELNGVSFLSEEKIVNNSSHELIDINSIPIPDRSLLKGSYIFNRLNGYPATIMCASRGCSYSCTYCAPHALDQAIELEYASTHSNKPPLRLQTTEQVISEFKQIALMGYKGVEICDNQFVWNKERTIEICRAIQYLQLSWICYSRPDHLLDRDMLRSMKSAGCKLIYIGTESFSQEIIEDIKKDLKLQDSYEAVRLVRECGIEPEVSVLLGASPLETEKTILHTIREARNFKTRFVHYSIAAPLPNTYLYKFAKQKGYLRTRDFVPIDNIREALMELPYIKAKKLKKLVRHCYAKQYLSLNFIFNMTGFPYFFLHLKNKLKVLFRLLKYRYSKL